MKDRRMKNHCMKFLYVKTKDIVNMQHELSQVPARNATSASGSGRHRGHAKGPNTTAAGGDDDANGDGVDDDNV